LALAAVAAFASPFTAPPLAALEFDPDDYGSITDYLNGIYGIDDNAGLTAFPVLNVPMGGRSEGMATAFSAVADDASFIEWNPAGSSMLENSELAFFHNNWIADTKIEGAVFNSRIKHLGLAAGFKWLYTPFTEYNSYGVRVSKGYYSEGVGILNASYNFFSNYYFSGLSLGVNLKGTFRFVPDYSTRSTDAESTTDTYYADAGSGAAQSAVGIMGDAGLLTRFNLFKFYYARERNASLAVVIRNLGPADGYNWWSDDYTAVGDALPTVAVVAVSYKPFRPLLFSFDFSVPLNMADVSLSEKAYWSAGFSAAVTNFLSMRAGFMMKAGNIRAAVGSAIDLSSIAIDVNYTLDLLTQFQMFNRVSIGVRFNLGDSGRKILAKRIDELYLSGLDAYSRGDDILARSLWETALELEPTFTPASLGIKAIDGYENITTRIHTLQEEQEELFQW
jgi:hypothetical protein